MPSISLLYLSSASGKGNEASEVLKTHLSKAKPGSEEEVSLKLCVAQVRQYPFDLLARMCSSVYMVLLIGVVYLQRSLLFFRLS